MFIVLLASIANAYNHTKCVSLSNQKCEIQLFLINLNPNKYCQELHNYLFEVNIDRFVGSCITLNDLSNKLYVLNKTGHLKIHVFNMVTRKNWIKKF